MKVSIVVPTFNREEVLITTISRLLTSRSRAEEILIVDQTQKHIEQTDLILAEWNKSGQIQWIRRSEPSITKAMNIGLSQAKNELVLFLDDDIEPRSDIIAVHRHAHEKQPDLWATVGQVIQPWQQPEKVQPPQAENGLRTDFDFPFHSSVDHDVQNVMAGNLCVNRERALSIGGFDENFVGAAFRFETEFARRIGKAGGRIQFLGSAGINHLRVTEGGTRSAGSHLTSASPRHGMGDHYYAFLHGSPIEAWTYSLRRVFREVSTKFHATHPWWIPVKLVGELRAMWAGHSLAGKKRVANRTRQ